MWLFWRAATDEILYKNNLEKEKQMFAYVTLSIHFNAKLESKKRMW